MVRTGCTWRQLPVDFPPWQTVYWYFTRWEEDNVTERILVALRRRVRAAQGRAAESTAGIIDSPKQQRRRHRRPGHPRLRRRQEGQRPQGFIVTDTLGLLLVVCVMAASVQDRDAAKTTLLSAYLFAPSGSSTPTPASPERWSTGASQRTLRTNLEIVRKAPGQKGFAVIARRWVVERSRAWLTAHRRLARDYERRPATSEAMIRWTAINGTLRRLTRGGPARRQRPGPPTISKPDPSQTRT